MSKRKILDNFYIYKSQFHKYISKISDAWKIRPLSTLLRETFPCYNLTNEEFLQTINDASRELEELYHFCTNLDAEINNECNKYIFDADLDTNLIDTLQSNYYMVEKLNLKLKNHTNGFTIIPLNCRSLNANFDQFKELLRNLEYQIDVICLTETWLTDDNCDLFDIPNYASYFANRQNKNGGGAVIYVKNTIEHKKSIT